VQYTTGLRAVISPLKTNFHQHLELLGIPTTSPKFSPKDVRASASKAEGALAPLAASARLLRRDISWGRFSGKDLDDMRAKIQRLVMRAHGMNVYFSLTDPTRERFPETPVPSRPSSPTRGTPNASRPSSPVRTEASPSVSPVARILMLSLPHTLSNPIFTVHCFVDITTGTRIYLRSWAPIITTISGNMSSACSSLSGISQRTILNGRPRFSVKVVNHCFRCAV
jgi:hypothetical protein